MENKIIFLTTLADIFLVVSKNLLNFDTFFRKTSYIILCNFASQVNESSSKNV